MIEACGGALLRREPGNDQMLDSDDVHLFDNGVEFIVDARKRHMGGNASDAGLVERFANGSGLRAAVAGEFDRLVPDRSKLGDGVEHVFRGLVTDGIKLNRYLHWCSGPPHDRLNCSDSRIREEES